MTREDKNLLLKDLSARLSYGLFVAVEETDDDSTMVPTIVPLYDEEGNLDYDNEPNIHSLISCNFYGECDIDDYSDATINEIKPYLRPMSSMTEDECKELSEIDVEYTVSYSIPQKPYYFQIVNYKQIDWLNSHHFDYRGLIEKGLALEAPEGMYK